MKKYYVDCTYKDFWGEGYVSNRFLCETEEEVKELCQRLQTEREVTSLTIITSEKII